MKSFNNEPQAIIIDIDGTVAEKYVNRDIYDFTQVKYDNPIGEVIWVLAGLQRVFVNLVPIFVSGRKEVCREATESWLKWNIDLGVHHDNLKLFMRQDGDNRDDAIVKREIYESNIKDKYQVFCVFDDRKKVIDMWRSLGLFVFNCSQLEDNNF